MVLAKKKKEKEEWGKGWERRKRKKKKKEDRNIKYLIWCGSEVNQQNKTKNKYSKRRGFSCFFFATFRSLSVSVVQPIPTKSLC